MDRRESAVISGRPATLHQNGAAMFTVAQRINAEASAKRWTRAARASAA